MLSTILSLAIEKITNMLSVYISLTVIRSLSHNSKNLYQIILQQKTIVLLFIQDSAKGRLEGFDISGIRYLVIFRYENRYMIQIK